jgi:nitrite reductase (NO-forming)
MTDDRPSKLSDAKHDRLTDAPVPSTRRDFIARASALGVALPAMGAAITGCTTPGQDGADSARAGTAARQSGGQRVEDVSNPSSRADSVHRGPHPTTTSATGSANVAYRRYDPTLPPLPAARTQRIHWRAQEVPVRVSTDTVVAAWTFEGDVPGPIVRCRVGDTIEFTLTNEGQVPHSMDFHAAQVDPAVAFRSVAKGQSVSYTFKPRYAGAFLYHCGTSPVLMHIGSGMVGAIIVDPPSPLPPAKEFVLVQSEFYLEEAQNGIRPFDYSKMLATLPDLVAFNGRPGQYMTEPIVVQRGDRVRFYVVDAGPTVPCAFHIVGEQFETVYLGAPPTSAIHGVQTFNVPAGGGMIFELVADVPGEFPFVNHGFGHGQKGAVGILKVE